MSTLGASQPARADQRTDLRTVARTVAQTDLRTGLRTSVRTDTSDFTFASFDADYFLGRDASGSSTLRTVEKLVAVFPQKNQNRGILRAIPDDYNGVPLNTKVISVSDSNGVKKAFDITDDGEFTTVSTGTNAYVHGRVTYTITYTQTNAVANFPDTNDDELYWDTNGTGWDQPFGTVTARVHVEPSLVSALTGKNACYRGAEGSKTPCVIAASAVHTTPSTAPAVITATTSKLRAGQNMTIVVSFTSGTFVAGTPADDGTGDGTTDGSGVGVFPGDDPAPAHPLWAEIIGGILALLGLGGIPFALLRRYRFGPRDAAGRGIIIAQYSVPKDLNVLDAAAIVKREDSGISAQIVSFAVRGNLRILNYPVTASGAEYTLQFLNATGVDAEEASLLGDLFGANPAAGAVCEITANTALATRLSALKSVVRAGLVTRGYRKKVSSLGGIVVGLALLGLLIVEVVFDILIGVLADRFSVFGLIAIPITFIAMLIAFAVAYRGSTLTDSGAEQRDYLLGMREYLQLAEADRLKMLQSPTGAERIDLGDKREMVKLYERLLPFAVLWGVENEWTKELAIHYQDGEASPDWFVSNSAFNSALFASSFAGLSAAVARSATPPSSTTGGSSWASSGGGSSFGGSGGGGFSGGGGGGGGGGGR
jgi:uncharacterized membrane protein YgcG